ncbi:HNH endonuclease [Pectobacterium carotovorum]|nr:HNH endonuclease [Pectobacterium carotovorum]
MKKQSRKQFILSCGATCKNWTWSWSFVNHEKKMVIFGAWENEREEGLGRTAILRESWKHNTVRKNNGYSQSVSHIGHVMNDGYELYTFDMINSKVDEEIAKINNFTPKLNKKYAKKENGVWFAYDEVTSNLYPDEVVQPRNYIEGTTKTVSINAFERNAEARMKCIEYYGYSCQCCGFDFEKFYGEVGKGFIHVHHRFPLSEIKSAYSVDPIKDLIPLCPNCHAMVHRENEVMSIEELKRRINSTKVGCKQYVSNTTI